MLYLPPYAATSRRVCEKKENLASYSFTSLPSKNVSIKLKLSFVQVFHQSINAPINVKPELGGGGGRATHRNLTVACIPRVGILIGHHALDLSILYSRREVNYFFLLILTILFRPGVEILIILFRKCQNPNPTPNPPPPPPLGLDTDRCITICPRYCADFGIRWRCRKINGQD